jgi:hypothetical protein
MPLLLKVAAAETASGSCGLPGAQNWTTFRHMICNIICDILQLLYIYIYINYISSYIFIYLLHSYTLVILYPFECCGMLWRDSIHACSWPLKELTRLTIWTSQFLPGIASSHIFFCIV